MGSRSLSELSSSSSVMCAAGAASDVLGLLRLRSSFCNAPNRSLRCRIARLGCSSLATPHLSTQITRELRAFCTLCPAAETSKGGLGRFTESSSSAFSNSCERIREMCICGATVPTMSEVAWNLLPTLVLKTTGLRRLR